MVPSKSLKSSADAKQRSAGALPEIIGALELAPCSWLPLNWCQHSELSKIACFVSETSANCFLSHSFRALWSDQSIVATGELAVRSQSESAPCLLSSYSVR